MAEDLEEKFLHTGDMILLLSDHEAEEGYLSLSLTDDLCELRARKDRDSLYRVYPMTQYTARKALKKKNKKKLQHLNGTSEMENDPEIKQLEDDQDIENASNEALLQELEGRVLIYGQIIQLMHINSSKFLSAKKSIDEVTWVKMDKEPGQKCFWKLCPFNSSSRLDGDRVLQADTLLLQHVKSGLYMHQEMGVLNEAGLCMINAVDRGTPWTFVPSDLPTHLSLPLVRAGSPFRLFHQETSGYVKLTRANNLRCKMNSAKKKIPTSPNSLWVVEVDDPTGVQPLHGEIMWNRPVHIKLYATDLYLAVLPNMEARSGQVLADQEIGLVNARWRSTPQATWMLDPIQKEMEHITYGSYIRLVSASKMLLHCNTDLNNPKKPHPLTATKKVFSNEQFQLKAVPKSQIDKQQYVQSRLHVLHNYLNTEMYRQPNSQSIRGVRNTLGELIQFSMYTDRESENPLEADGPTIKFHQTLLGNPAVIDILVRMVRVSMVDDTLTCRYVLRLLRATVKSNIRNGIALHKHITAFTPVLHSLPPEFSFKMSHLGLPDLLSEMCRDNKTVSSNLGEHIIDHFISILRQARDFKYISLLSDICICKGAPVHANQQMIVCKLLDQNPDLLFKTRVRTELEISLSHDQWVSLHDFIEYGAEQDRLYFEASLELYAKLCMGPHYSGITAVTRFASFKECFLCLRDEALAPRLRGVYSSVILHCYVNCYPQKAYTDTNLVWGFTRSMLAEPAPTPFSLLAPPPAKGPPPVLDNPSNLRQFLVSFVLRADYPGPEDRTDSKERWSFFLTILSLVRFAFRFGFFKNEEFYLLSRFREILDNRVADNSDNLEAILVEIKIEILRILHHYVDLQTKQSLRAFQNAFVLSDQFRPSDPEQRTLEAMITFLEQIDWDKIYSAHKIPNHDDSICHQLLGLLKHENTTLTEEVLHVLARIQKSTSPVGLLWKVVVSQQIVTMTTAIKRYEIACEHLESLLKVTCLPMSKGDYPVAAGHVDYFTSICLNPEENEPDYSSQILVGNLNMHVVALDILKLSYVEGAGMSQLFRACYTLLRMFVLYNPNNQKLLYPAVPFMISQLARWGNTIGIAETLLEIFRGNNQLCVQMGIDEELLIFQFVELALQEQDPKYIRVLKILCAPNEEVIPANQTIIIRALAQNKQAVRKVLLLDPNIVGGASTEESLELEVPSWDSDPRSSKLRVPNRWSARLSGSTLSLPTTKDSVSPTLPRREKSATMERRLSDLPPIEGLSSSPGSGGASVLMAKRRSIDISRKSNEFQPLLEHENKTPRGFTPHLAAFTPPATPEIAPRLPTPLRPRDEAVTADIPSELAFHIELVFLMGWCAANRNSDGALGCRNLLPIDVILNVITDGMPDVSLKAPWAMKAAYAHLLLHTYFNQEYFKPEMLDIQSNKDMWTFINQFSFQLEEFVYSQSSSGLLTSRRKINGFVKFSLLPSLCILDIFYTKVFSLEKASNQQSLVSNKLLDDLLQLCQLEISNLAIAAAEGGVIISCLAKMLDLGNQIKVLQATERTVRGMDKGGFSSHNFKTQVDKILRSTLDIADKLESNRNAQLVVEVTQPTRSFSNKHLELQRLKRRVYDSIACLLPPIQADMANTPSFLELLVDQLRDINVTNNAKLRATRVLVGVLRLETNSDRKQVLQNYLTNMDLPVVAIILLGSMDTRVASAVRSLLLLLLDNGADKLNPKPNIKVRDSIIGNFTSRPDETFFKNIYDYIQVAKDKVRDMKRPMKNKRRRLVNANVTLKVNSNTKRKTISLVDQPSDIMDSQVVVSELIHKSRSQENFPFEENVALWELPTHVTQEFVELMKIFCLLQLLAQGSSIIFKNYIRAQQDNYQSFDILREIVQFLKLFDSLVDTSREALSVSLLLFKCLKEMIKQTPANQHSVVSAQICSPINNILHKDFGFAFSDAGIDLKTEVVDFMLTLLDRDDLKVVSRLVAQLDFRAMEKTTLPLAETGEVGNVSERVIRLASMVFRLLKILYDFDNTKNNSLANALVTCGDHCKSRIGRIEIVRNAKLERVYFAIPPSCRQIIMGGRKEQAKVTKEAEKALQLDLEESLITWKIDWKKSNEKLDGFVRWSEDRLTQMEHEAHMYANRYQAFLINYAKWWRRSSYVCALLTNVLLIIYSARTYSSLSRSDSLFYAIVPIGILFNVSMAFHVFRFFIKEGPVIFFKGWKAHLATSNSSMLMSNKERLTLIRNSLPFYKFYLQSARIFLGNGLAMYHILSLIFSLLGSIVSPFFFAYHITIFTIKSRATDIVLKAITVNKNILILISIFILETVYAFSIVSYIFFSQSFTMDSGTQCNSLWQCFASILYYGIPSGGQLVQFIFLTESDWNNPGYLTAWLIFMVLFYVASTVILLNVILGVIVDTFGQIRDKRAETEQDKTAACFICNVDREVFQRRAIDFNRHTEDDHNKWHYLYFFAYLKERKYLNQTNQLTEQEEYVYQQISSNNIFKFFPVDTAICLRDTEANQEEEEMSNKLFKKLGELEQRLAASLQWQLSNAVSGILEEFKSIRSSVEIIKNNSNKNLNIINTPKSNNIFNNNNNPLPNINSNPNHTYSNPNTVPNPNPNLNPNLHPNPNNLNPNSNSNPFTKMNSSPSLLVSNSGISLSSINPFFSPPPDSNNNPSL